MKKKTKISKVGLSQDTETKRVVSSSKKNFPKKDFLVVGIGASAGGLETLKNLLSHLSPDTGMAFIIIQHLDPKHKSMSPVLLAQSTKMPLEEIENGMRVEPNHVYVTPSNCNLEFSRGHFKILPRKKSRGQNFSLDFFFQTLAVESKARAIGIILSGTANDGTKGLQAIKAQGGYTIAQDPQSAKYDDMPRNAIASGAVDFISNVEGIAAELKRFAKHPNRHEPKVEKEKTKTLSTDESFKNIFSVLRSTTNIDFSHYKRNTISRRIARRMLVRKIDDLSKYSEYLEINPEEIKILFEDILIHVTSFFRDKKVFETLKTKVLPKYVKNRDPNLPFRVWVVGCSTGEEVYSLAMTIIEFQEDYPENLKKNGRPRIPISIFGTDISEQALEKARRGIYPETIAQNVSKERLRKYFDKVEGGYRISKWLRDMCLFSKHDVTRDPPFAKVDLISCRNVLIYFDTELHKFVFPIFHYALNSGGILLLGKSETAGSFSNIFSLVDKSNKLYFKKNVAAPSRIRLPVGHYSTDRLEVGVKRIELEANRFDVQRESDRIALLEYAPPSVVINDALEIVQSRGRIFPFLELSSGQPSLNILRMAHPELVRDLRIALQAALKKNDPIIKHNLSFQDEGKSKNISIRIVPIPTEPNSKDRYFAVFFEENKNQHRQQEFNPDAKDLATSAKEYLQNIKHLNELKKKLADSQEYQQSLIEEYETSQEELISSNEELQSMNEELQSTNEELETAKEELQSTNEELTTINDELQAKNIEAINLNNDLTNLLASVDIPIVMVGPDGKIRRFTPKAAKIMKLIITDIGRPIGDIRPNIHVADLDQLVYEVMDTMMIKEIETKDKNGCWYQLQLRPYRTSENKIDGVVISLIDINIIKRHSEALEKFSYDLKKVHEDAATIIESQPIPLLVIDSDQRVKFASENFCKKFNVSRAMTEGKMISELGSGQWKIPELNTLIYKTLTDGINFEQFQVTHNFPLIGQRELILSTKKVELAGSGETVVLLSIDDITEKLNTEIALKDSDEKYHTLITNAYDGIIIVKEDEKIEFSNLQIEKMFCYTAEELHNRPFEILIPDQLRPFNTFDQLKYKTEGSSEKAGLNLEISGKRKDGSEFPVEISISPVNTTNHFYITVIIRDISERKEIEKKLAEVLLKEKRANQIKDEFLAMLSHELRTPLTSILAWSQMLQRGNLQPEKIKLGLEVLEQSAKIQGQLINDLLDISKIQAGKLNLTIQEIHPAQVIEAAIDSTRRMASTKLIHIETKFDPSVKIIFADPMRLQQIMWNLITNSIKFSSKEGKIWITMDPVTSRTGKSIQIQVRDNGRGIRPDFLPLIFDSFTQVDSTSTRAHGGLGLGLSIVKRLVELHGGSITAESPGEDLGATFTISLPVDLNKKLNKKEEKEETKEPNAEVTLAGLRILLVDDELSAREVFTLILESFGAEVRAVESASKALEAYKDFMPHVLVSDISMPEEDGYSLISKIRAEKSVIPALALTANAGPENIQHSLGAGFQAHIAKPIDTYELIRTIAKLAGRKI